MNEFELQTQIMKARDIKPSDKFVMLVILKHVDWSTWTGRITQTYLCEYADIPRATFSRAVKRLKDAGWLTVDCDRKAFNKFQTTIKVNINSIKMSQPLSQNETIDCVKMIQPLSQNDTTVSQNDTTLSQNDAYINNTNINNIKINEDNQEYASKQEALEHTSSQPFESLSYMVDERGKVPFHILSAKHRRLEMERRWNKDDISKQDHNVFAIRRVRDTFENKEIREDFDIYDSKKPVKKTWR